MHSSAVLLQLAARTSLHRQFAPITDSPNATWPWLSLAALVVAIVVSCTTQLNVGVLALALAWIVGVYVGGMRLDDVVAGFPVQLFLTLAGVTLLFTQAQ